VTQKTQLLYLVLLSINIIAYSIMRIDKVKAKKGSARFTEKMLLLWAFFLGGLGIFIGMYFPTHHKTKNIKFYILVPVLVILQIAGFIFLSQWFF